MDQISMAIFKLPEHQRILKILQSLDAQFLTDCNALFGGGTLVSLSHGNFESARILPLFVLLGQVRVIETYAIEWQSGVIAHYFNALAILNFHEKSELISTAFVV
jgi:hypothetical protein